jgi:hypothetical protein
MWLRDILHARHAAPDAAPAAAPEAVPPEPASSQPVSSQIAPVPGPTREFRLSAIADDDATQRSAGVPDLRPELAALADDDGNTTIGRFRDCLSPAPSSVARTGSFPSSAGAPWGSCSPRSIRSSSAPSRSS